MIFSISQAGSVEQLPSLPENADVFCCFNVPSAVKVPEKIWFQAILSSLRLKREVWIFERPLSSFPSHDPSKRWQVGPGWVWIAPRAQRVLFEANLPIDKGLAAVKSFLTENK